MESSQTHSQWAYRESFDQPVHQMQSFNRNGAIFEDEGILVGGWDPRRTLTPRKINGQYGICLSTRIDRKFCAYNIHRLKRGSHPKRNDC
jgi:hypothetical protein